jgi:PAS domain S-box-containing protein
VHHDVQRRVSCKVVRVTAAVPADAPSWRSEILSHGLSVVAVRDGRVYEGNAAAAHLFGDKCVGMAVDELFSGPSRSKLGTLLSRNEPAITELEVIRSGEPVTVQFILLALPGESLLVQMAEVGHTEEMLVRLMRANQKLVSLTEELSTRIDELHATKHALAEEHEIERLVRAELEELGRASGAVAEAVAELPSSDVSAVLYMIALQARALTHAAYVGLGIGTDPAKPFQPWISLGVSSEIEHAIGRSPRPVGLLGVVAREGEILRSGDLRSQPRFRGFPPSHPEMGAFLGVPIHYRGRPVGNLYLANKPGAPEFSERDEHLIRMLAARVGVAIETARLYVSERVERTWLQDIIDQMPDGVVLFDERGRLKAMNQASAAFCCESTGRTDPFGNPILFDLRQPDGRELPAEALPNIRAIRNQEVTVRKEAFLRRCDGELVAVSMSAVPVRDAGGNVSGATMVIEDISGWKDAERMREEWTAVVAHDLRQPVGIISLAADLLHRVHASGWSESDRRALERIQLASRQLDRMISDLTQASLLESKRLSLEVRLVDVGELVEAAAESLRELARGYDVRVSTEGKTLAWIDPDRIHQVLTNLVSNAAKYGQPGTEIRIEVRARDDTLEVTVSNHGPGITPEQLPMIFTKFVRTAEARSGKARGLGVGLYIAKGLVEAHGGRMWAESVPGDITTFHFTLRRGEWHPTRVR